MMKDADASQIRISNKMFIYNNRKDVLAIKEEIVKQVKNPEYWDTFVFFLHKQLTKDEFDAKMKSILFNRKLQLLHNKLVRAILFNAHYSTIQPPGVNIPSKLQSNLPIKAMPLMSIPKSLGFPNYTSAELHHLPSIDQLKQRIKFLMFSASNDFKIEKEAIEVLHHALLLYINSILTECYSLAKPDFSFHDTAKIQVWHLIHIYHSNTSLSKVLSPELITKYTTLCK